MEQQSTVNVLVIWRGKQLIVEVDSDSTIKDFGLKLQKLTNAKSDTMRLLVPQSKSSKLITPFSDEHSSLSLRDISILEGKPIRMMGASDYEIEEVSHSSSKADLRIIGFDEEEKRMRQRSSRPETALRLPTGPYIFCDFRTLHIPGIELNPPASEALKRMHMLACDPGIIAIMNKHHWRVGIMTELAPVGYVGISPKCLLGFNKNHGEEISLRLRTDDLKGFRKYESIKKTLLHELAHMVYSEHDADFYALDKQLNKEAESLDWTKSRSHTLSGRKVSVHHEEDIPLTSASDYRGQKLGGASDTQLATARAASVAAAYHRLLNSPTNCTEVVLEQSSHTDAILAEGNHIANKDDVTVPENDDIELKIDRGEIYANPDPDDAISVGREKMHDNKMLDEPVSGDCFEPPNVQELDLDDCHAVKEASRDEPDPDDSLPEPTKSSAETDPDDLLAKRADAKLQRGHETSPSDAGTDGIMEDKALKGVSLLDGKNMELDSDSSQAMGTVKVDPHPDDSMDGWDSEELKVIEEPVSAICSRLQRAIKLLRSEAPPAEATSALQTLFKIIRNVIDHPNDVKFRRFRKANPSFQRNVANYKAAMEFLTHIGFCEDVISDEFGRAETYLILKRNDPGLLWLAKSSLEVSIP